MEKVLERGERCHRQTSEEAVATQGQRRGLGGERH